MLVELIENGLEAEKRKRQEFFELAERLRASTDPKTSSASGLNSDVWSSAADAEDRPIG